MGEIYEEDDGIVDDTYHVVYGSGVFRGKQ